MFCGLNAIVDKEKGAGMILPLAKLRFNKRWLTQSTMPA